MHGTPRSPEAKADRSNTTTSEAAFRRRPSPTRRLPMGVTVSIDYRLWEHILASDPPKALWQSILKRFLILTRAVGRPGRVLRTQTLGFLHRIKSPRLSSHPRDGSL